MNKKSIELDNWVKYTIVSYMLFWAMVLVLGGTAAMVLKVSPVTMRLVALSCSWAPTIAFILMSNKLLNGESLSQFIVKSFKPRLEMLLTFTSGLVVTVGVLLAVFIVSSFNGIEYNESFSMNGYPLIAAILFSFFAGPTGEELGWRGYLRVELDKRYSFVKASIVGGAIWAFWHSILWMIDSEFSGLALLLYVLSNVVVMTSIVFIMNVVMKRSANLWNAIWIHLCFNFPYSLIKVEGIEFYMAMTIIFPIIALMFVALFHKTNGNKPSISNN